MHSEPKVKTGIKTGTLTTGTYKEVLRVDTRGCGVQGKLLALIYNSTTGTSVYWKIDGYPADVDGTLGGRAVAVKAETLLGETTSVTSTDTDKGYAAVVVSMRMNCLTGVTAPTPAMYQLDYETY